MLRTFLRTALRQVRRQPEGDPASPPSFPVEELTALKALHERAPIEAHTRILYGDSRICGTPLLELFDRCIAETGTQVSRWKAFVRIQAAANLARYFVRSLDLDGARCECGVFRGFSALFACRAAASARGKYAGRDLHLVDSFKGFPKPRQEDFIPVRMGEKSGSAPAFGEGDAAVSFEEVRRVFRDFPDVRFHQGYIPEVLGGLPETRWAFVHIDVDLHEPTRASLEYFHPRMAAGGTIVCDDYGSKLFPGARKAWDGYCEANGIPFVVLETGQSVLVA